MIIIIIYFHTKCVREGECPKTLIEQTLCVSDHLLRAWCTVPSVCLTLLLALGREGACPKTLIGQNLCVSDHLLCALGS